MGERRSDVFVAGLHDAAPTIEVFQADVGTASHGGQRIGAGSSRQSGLIGQEAVEASQQRSAAGQHQPVVGQIGNQIGAAPFERGLDGFHDLE